MNIIGDNDESKKTDKNKLFLVSFLTIEDLEKNDFNDYDDNDDFNDASCGKTKNSTSEYIRYYNK